MRRWAKAPRVRPPARRRKRPSPPPGTHSWTSTGPAPARAGRAASTSAADPARTTGGRSRLPSAAPTTERAGLSTTGGPSSRAAARISSPLRATRVSGTGTPKARASSTAAALSDSRRQAGSGGAASRAGRRSPARGSSASQAASVIGRMTSAHSVRAISRTRPAKAEGARAGSGTIRAPAAERDAAARGRGREARTSTRWRGPRARVAARAARVLPSVTSTVGASETRARRGIKRAPPGRGNRGREYRRRPNRPASAGRRTGGHALRRSSRPLGGAGSGPGRAGRGICWARAAGRRRDPHERAPSPVRVPHPTDAGQAIGQTAPAPRSRPGRDRSRRARRARRGLRRRPDPRADGPAGLLPAVRRRGPGPPVPEHPPGSPHRAGGGGAPRREDLRGPRGGRPGRGAHGRGDREGRRGEDRALQARCPGDRLGGPAAQPEHHRARRGAEPLDLPAGAGDPGGRGHRAGGWAHHLRGPEPDPGDPHAGGAGGGLQGQSRRHRGR